MREASYALGKTKAATIRRVLLPAARPGIATGTALGMGRIAGDTAIVVVLLGAHAADPATAATAVFGTLPRHRQHADQLRLQQLAGRRGQRAGEGLLRGLRAAARSSSRSTSSSTGIAAAGGRPHGPADAQPPRAGAIAILDAAAAGAADPRRREPTIGAAADGNGQRRHGAVARRLAGAPARAQPRPEGRADARPTTCTIAYGDKVAVDGVTLPVRQGEVLALIGPSGCGKTTLLRSLNRLVELTPTATPRAAASRSTARTSTASR